MLNFIVHSHSSTRQSDAEAEVFGMTQTLFIGACYAYILFYASNQISEGSEKLLLIPSWRSVVGTVVLPILGAVPDGAIVLFSGLGDDAQNQIAVGVGALAGSTIMLLTIPWFLTIYAGRVPITKNGTCDYTGVPKCPKSPSFTHALFQTGVEVKNAVWENSNYMLGTVVSYLFLQCVLFFDDKGSNGMKDKDDEEHLDNLKDAQRYVALATLVVCFLFFAAYLYKMITQSPDEKKHTSSNIVAEAKFMKRLKKCISSGDVSIMSALFEELTKSPSISSLNDNLKTPLRGSSSKGRNQNTTTNRLIQICKPVFNRYDLDKSGMLCTTELNYLFRDLGIGNAQMIACRDQIEKLDHDKNGKVTLKELCEWIPSFAKYVSTTEYLSRLSKVKKELKLKTNELRRARSQVPDNDEEAKMDDEIELNENGEPEEEEEEEEEEVDETYFVTDKNGNHVRDQNGKLMVDYSRVKYDAFKQMAIGTVLVLIFSDPMCGVFTSIGERTGIDAFYISFVLAPLASNASELIASVNFAAKKTSHTTTVSMTQLEGAAIMNNTFCLGIFALLIFAKDLAWTFSAETLSIILVQIAMYIVARMKTQSLAIGYLVLALYPLSIIFVAVMEKAVGLD